MTDLTPELVQAGARALVWHENQGCVSWEDTTDTATSGDETTRQFARDRAAAVLIAVVPLIEAAAVERERERIASRIDGLRVLYYDDGFDKSDYIAQDAVLAIIREGT